MDPYIGDWFKLNVDVAVKEVAGSAGLEAIVRNEEGKVMVAAMYKRTFFGDVAKASLGDWPNSFDCRVGLLKCGESASKTYYNKRRD